MITEEGIEKVARNLMEGSKAPVIYIIEYDDMLAEGDVKPIQPKELLLGKFAVMLTMENGYVTFSYERTGKDTFKSRIPGKNGGCEAKFFHQESKQEGDSKTIYWFAELSLSDGANEAEFAEEAARIPIELTAINNLIRKDKVKMIKRS